MIFAVTDPGATGSSLSSLGVPGLVFLVVASWGVIGILYKEWKASQKREISQLEARVNDAKEINDKIKEPLETLTLLNKQMYDLLLQLLQRGK